MRSTSSLLPAVLVLLSVGCGSSAPPATTASAAKPSTSAKGGGLVGKRIVLVEADGPRTETDLFVSRFLSEASDRALVAIVDARLSGARFAQLVTEADARARFRESFPADLLLQVRMAPCNGKSSTTMVPATTYSGVPSSASTLQAVSQYQTECSVSLNLVDAQDGHVASSADVVGWTTREGAESSEEAAIDAATRAAKKLFK